MNGQISINGFGAIKVRKKAAKSGEHCLGFSKLPHPLHILFI